MVNFQFTALILTIYRRTTNKRNKLGFTQASLRSLDAICSGHIRSLVHIKIKIYLVSNAYDVIHVGPIRRTCM